MPKRPGEPDAGQRWKTFLLNHREVLASMDFFTFPTATFRVLYVFFVIHHARRRALHVRVGAHPTAAWIRQQFREAFPFYDQGHLVPVTPPAPTRGSTAGARIVCSRLVPTFATAGAGLERD